MVAQGGALKFGGRDGARPFGAAERTVVEAGAVLVTGELAIFAERDDVEPVAVGVEVIFGVIFVPFNAVGDAECLGFGPGLGLDADELDVAGVAGLVDKIVTEFVQELERGSVGRVKNAAGRGEFGELARLETEIGIVGAEFSDEFV